MAYTVIVPASVQKAIAKLPTADGQRIWAVISALAREPRPHRSTKLVGSMNLWRIRVGDYRVVYAIDDTAHTVTVIKAAPRKDAYR